MAREYRDSVTHEDAAKDYYEHNAEAAYDPVREAKVRRMQLRKELQPRGGRQGSRPDRVSKTVRVSGEYADLIMAERLERMQDEHREVREAELWDEMAYHWLVKLGRIEE